MIPSQAGSVHLSDQSYSGLILAPSEWSALGSGFNLNCTSKLFESSWFNQLTDQSYSGQISVNLIQWLLRLLLVRQDPCILQISTSHIIPSQAGPICPSNHCELDRISAPLGSFQDRPDPLALQTRQNQPCVVRPSDSKTGPIRKPLRPVWVRLDPWAP